MKSLTRGSVAGCEVVPEGHLVPGDGRQAFACTPSRFCMVCVVTLCTLAGSIGLQPAAILVATPLRLLYNSLILCWAMPGVQCRIGSLHDSRRRKGPPRGVGEGRFENSDHEDEAKSWSWHVRNFAYIILVSGLSCASCYAFPRVSIPPQRRRRKKKCTATSKPGQRPYCGQVWPSLLPFA